MKRRPRDHEVIVEMRGQVVDRMGPYTRRGARSSARGLNIAFGRGMRVVERGGPFRAPRYESTGIYARARELAR